MRQLATRASRSGRNKLHAKVARADKSNARIRPILRFANVRGLRRHVVALFHFRLIILKYHDARRRPLSFSNVAMNRVRRADVRVKLWKVNPWPRPVVINMPVSNKSVTLAGSALRHSCHACAFFHSKEEEYRVLMPFIMEGFQQGDRAFHIVSPHHRAAHLARLGSEGVDIATAQADGQLDVQNWDDTYLNGGRFDQDLMIETLLKMIAPGNAPPGKISRNIANMEWALEDRPGVHEIVEYEARLNDALPEHHDPVVCTYDLSQFDAGVVIDIMRTHPMVIIGGILQENPFFIPSEQMLEEIRARKAAGAGQPALTEQAG